MIGFTTMWLPWRAPETTWSSWRFLTLLLSLWRWHFSKDWLKTPSMQPKTFLRLWPRPERFLCPGKEEGSRSRLLFWGASCILDYWTIMLTLFPPYDDYRTAITKKIGQLFIMRINVNLVSNILDTPEIFWSEPSFQPLYSAIRGIIFGLSYLSVVSGGCKWSIVYTNCCFCCTLQ